MTGNQLFESAVDLCGLRSSMYDVPTDILDLSLRALSLINLLLSENSSLDCRIRKCDHTLLQILSLEEELPCSDIVASTVLPYGLARLFMLGEDDALANEMERLYNEAKVTALKFGKAKRRAITEVYS